ncbi:MBL fold metallo-hydrolase [Hymenobacter endophyticus]|uniref:MBL fold metallo-hydrolase n=1 Tax=Hymenobacter endophyticus TaxID=3076335 RepID=A0ABU3TF92_9BACT|nr:MBL fold metallo-hydrolase [Hymenobacter endophyticus]MDU0370033.1 MBL fold metallo-hydrolase [Hymenobacter endophyticus]
MLHILGKNPAIELQRRFASLTNYQNGRFQNLGGVKFSVGEAPMRKMLLDFLRKPRTVTPSRPLPTVQTDLHHPTTELPTIIWFGHSSYLIQARGLNILVDPVFSGAASPVSFAVRAYAGADAYTVADLPPIDVLVLTHDHYDHLDYATVTQLRGKVKHVVTPLGVSGHLGAWGYAPEQLTELNWHETTEPVPGVQLTATPAQHMSGRSLKPQRTLWASYVLQLNEYRLFLGGDSGYGPHFRAIGEQYGPFDVALLENGQYNLSWQAIHCLPEETVQAAQDLGAKLLLPVHWAKFTLAYHPWNEPVQLVLQAADSAGLPVTVPRIGEAYTLGTPPKRDAWWAFD